MSQNSCLDEVDSVWKVQRYTDEIDISGPYAEEVERLTPYDHLFHVYNNQRGYEEREAEFDWFDRQAQGFGISEESSITRVRILLREWAQLPAAERCQCRHGTLPACSQDHYPGCEGIRPKLKKEQVMKAIAEREEQLAKRRVDLVTERVLAEAKWQEEARLG